MDVRLKSILRKRFCILNRNEEQLQNILQVVEKDRKNVPNQRKLAARKKNWFLQIENK